MITNKNPEKSNEPAGLGTGYSMIAVSDLHLGSKFSRSRELLQFLKSPEVANATSMYLLGDIFDGYKWGSNWWWTKHDEDLLHFILGFAFQSPMQTPQTPAKQVFYTPGNHDEFLRDVNFLSFTGEASPRIQIANEFIYEAPETSNKKIVRKRYLMLHGDFFDAKRELHPMFYYMGDFLYDVLLSVSSRLLPKGSKLPAKIKSHTKGVTKYILSYEEHLAAYAASKKTNGVVCGHIHTPIDKYITLKNSTEGTRTQSVRYLNCGSWITGEYNGAVVYDTCKEDLRLLTF